MEKNAIDAPRLPKREREPTSQSMIILEGEPAPHPRKCYGEQGGKAPSRAATRAVLFFLVYLRDHGHNADN